MDIASPQFWDARDSGGFMLPRIMPGQYSLKVTQGFDECISYMRYSNRLKLLSEKCHGIQSASIRNIYRAAITRVKRILASYSTTRISHRPVLR